MNWLKKRKQSEEVSYWQTIADALAALLMIVLLITMLLILYIVRIPDEDYVDLYEGDNYHEYLDNDAGAGNYGSRDPDEGAARYWEEGDEEDGDGEDLDRDGGGGGGSGGGGEGYPEGFPEEGHGEGDGTGKAAVYVMVLDAETERSIKEAGIRFELYDDHDMLQLLNTYYPHKTEYRNYDTTKDGVFYLPEKIAMGGYYLHEITAPAGYDAAENLFIPITEAYDWPDPYVARVFLSPSRNIIRIQMKDGASGEVLEGAAYDVIAAEDIITGDGTLRYKKDSLVCTIECDSEGYGESPELYLGEYLLQERDVPEYYARELEQIRTDVEKKNNDAEPPVKELTNNRTTVVVTVVDELYENLPVVNASFTFTKSGGTSQTVVTDELGQITLSSLDKGTAYSLRQKTSAEGYSLQMEPIQFSVSEEGRIEDEDYREYVISNRTLRASISVKGRILQNLVSDYNVTLYDGEDQIVEIWDSTGMAHTVEGLKPGDYYIRINGQEKSQQHITISDEKEIQKFSYSVWTTADIGAMGMILVFAVGTVIVISILVRGKLKKKSE